MAKKATKTSVLTAGHYDGVIGGYDAYTPIATMTLTKSGNTFTGTVTLSGSVHTYPITFTLKPVPPAIPAPPDLVEGTINRLTTLFGSFYATDGLLHIYGSFDSDILSGWFSADLTQ